MANGPAAGAPRPDVVVGWPLVAPADLTLVEAGLEGLTNTEIRGAYVRASRHREEPPQPFLRQARCHQPPPTPPPQTGR
jgi:hypothetical protein